MYIYIYIYITSRYDIMIPRSQLGVLCPSLLHLTWKSKLQRTLQVISETAETAIAGRTVQRQKGLGQNGTCQLNCWCQEGVEHGGTWWNMVEHGGTWWNMVEHGGTWWNMVEHGGTWWNMVEPRLRCKSEDVRSNASFGCLFNQLEWFWMILNVHLRAFNII